jgi:hypothetical protein
MCWPMPILGSVYSPPILDQRACRPATCTAAPRGHRAGWSWPGQSRLHPRRLLRQTRGGGWWPGLSCGVRDGSSPQGTEAVSSIPDSDVPSTSGVA